jgi:hypothetical protein
MIQSSNNSVDVIDGFLIDPQWFGPYEGAYTVLAKIVAANALTPSDISSIVNVALPAGLVESRSRSFLNVEWLRRKNPLSAAAHYLVGRGLSDICARWWREIAGDEHFRYCPECLSYGFQSPICQVDKVTLCPLHCIPLIDFCQRCGTSCPHYGLSRKGFLRPLVCSGCEEAIVDGWWPFMGETKKWRNYDGARAYAELARHLGGIGEISCSWTERKSWLRSPYQNKSSSAERLRYHDLLCFIRSEKVESYSPELKIKTFPVCANAPHPTLGLGLKSQSRRQIYKSIRRNVSRRLGLTRKGISNSQQHLIWEYPGCVAMPMNGNVSSELHGFLAWRSRFEKFSLQGELRGGREGALEIREEMLCWPVNWLIEDGVWGYFVYACLLVELNQASKLKASLGNIDYESASDRLAWFDVVNNFGHDFGGAKQLLPKSLTYMRTHSAGESRMIVAWVMNDL